jgi:hypothetical protein
MIVEVDDNYTEEEIVRKIEFDGGNFCHTERGCYIHAMRVAYDMKRRDECLGNLEFIAC